IAEGISYLHNRIVIHSDIKSDNVLVSPGGDPLICDFGLSRLIVATHTMNAVTQSGTQRGSTRCMSPEIIEPPDGHVTYSEQSDIWAFGMTIYMSSGELAYFDVRSSAQLSLSGNFNTKETILQTWNRVAGHGCNNQGYPS
ncbi:kinase-like protein, partial [Fomitiporia mediterranea MF3/22]|uniref:kinase-like protein n=1 Tax=Fomitiporia mediterranea (strain MF3/22) TaxID=694068 RepID=UPI0004408A0B